MKSVVFAAAVLATLVAESYGNCSGPGVTCQKKNNGDVTCTCQAGYGCRPWIGTTGSPGHGKCQSNECLGEGVVCSGFVGVCCPGYKCIIGDDGVRTCTLVARSKRFKTCALGAKCASRKWSGFKACRGCPLGSSCRTWIKSNGAYGHGFCQLDECIAVGEDCSGRKGQCCASHTCTNNVCVKNADVAFSGDKIEPSLIELIVE